MKELIRGECESSLDERWGVQGQEVQIIILSKTQYTTLWPTGLPGIKKRPGQLREDTALKRSVKGVTL